jgi:hypothetical protein
MLFLQVAIHDGGVQAVVSPAQVTVSVDIVLPVIVAVCGAVIGIKLSSYWNNEHVISWCIIGRYVIFHAILSQNNWEKYIILTSIAKDPFQSFYSALIHTSALHWFWHTSVYIIFLLIPCRWLCTIILMWYCHRCIFTKLNKRTGRGLLRWNKVTTFLWIIW